MPDNDFRPALARLAAGVLYHNGDKLMLVQPTYKQSWDIPGGYVEPGESPRDACKREVREELGLDAHVGRLLVVDWAPQASDGDKLLFVFDGGNLAESERQRITVDGHEIRECRYFSIEETSTILTDRLFRRLSAAIKVAGTADVAALYLEHGREVDTPGTS